MEVESDGGWGVGGGLKDLDIKVIFNGISCQLPCVLLPSVQIF